MDEAYRLVVAGAGRQRGFSIPESLSRVAFEKGTSARTSESLGIAGFGGSYTTHVCIGGKAQSGVTPDGKGDLVLGLDPIEALRASVRYLSIQGVVVTNTTPLTLVTLDMPTESPDPNRILGLLRKYVKEVFVVDAVQIASEEKNMDVFNTAMMGALASTGRTPLTSHEIRRFLEKFVSREASEAHLSAFDSGSRKVKKL